MRIKKVILAVLFSLLTLGSNQYSSVKIKKEAIEEPIHEYVPQTKRSSISFDESSWQEDVKTYLSKKYRNSP